MLFQICMTDLFFITVKKSVMAPIMFWTPFSFTVVTKTVDLKIDLYVFRTELGQHR